MLGGGVGIGLSLHFSADGITPGLSRALTSGTLWGVWHGAMLGVATRAFVEANDEGKTTALALGLGQVSGMALGGALYAALEPTAGQVSLTSSGGIWTTAATGLGMLRSTRIRRKRPWRSSCSWPATSGSSPAVTWRAVRR